MPSWACQCMLQQLLQRQCSSLLRCCRLRALWLRGQQLQTRWQQLQLQRRQRQRLCALLQQLLLQLQLQLWHQRRLPQARPLSLAPSQQQPLAPALLEAPRLQPPPPLQQQQQLLLLLQQLQACRRRQQLPLPSPLLLPCSWLCWQGARSSACSG
jgi:hypothetical protein